MMKRYEIPNLNACSDINSWWVINNSFIVPKTERIEFDNRKDAVSYFESFINFCLKDDMLYDLRIGQGHKILLEESNREVFYE